MNSSVCTVTYNIPMYFNTFPTFLHHSHLHLSDSREHMCRNKRIFCLIRVFIHCRHEWRDKLCICNTRQLFVWKSTCILSITGKDWNPPHSTQTCIWMHFFCEKIQTTETTQLLGQVFSFSKTGLKTFPDIFLEAASKSGACWVFDSSELVAKRLFISWSTAWKMYCKNKIQYIFFTRGPNSFIY